LFYILLGHAAAFPLQFHARQTLVVAQEADQGDLVPLHILIRPDLQECHCVASCGIISSWAKYGMALISFQDWRQRMSESSPLTRWRSGWARYGNYPPRADVMSHSTPTPFEFEKAKEEFGTTEHPKKKYKHKHKKDK
jgi:hypothetical protein